MAGIPKGLGKGLGALFTEEATLTAIQGGGQQLALSSLLPNPKQPRKTFDSSALEELASSIRSQGVLQPILVRSFGKSSPGNYEIVAGERRWRAAKLAGLQEVPVIVKELTDQEALAISLIENLQRTDLNALEEAAGMQQLKEEFGLSQEDLAQKLGKSRSAIANSLRLLNLSDQAQKDLQAGRLSAGHARAILAFGGLAEQEAARRRIIAEKLSVREAEGFAAQKKESTATAVKPAATSTEKNSATGRRLPQSAVLLNLQSKIAKAIQLTVKISGQENRGTINITYNSKEELAKLLAKLGL
jgi:ParB family chromosome partitioning protein